MANLTFVPFLNTHFFFVALDFIFCIEGGLPELLHVIQARYFYGNLNLYFPGQRAHQRNGDGEIISSPVNGVGSALTAHRTIGGRRQFIIYFISDLGMHSGGVFVTQRDA